MAVMTDGDELEAGSSSSNHIAARQKGQANAGWRWTWRERNFVAAAGFPAVVASVVSQ